MRHEGMRGMRAAGVQQVVEGLETLACPGGGLVHPLWASTTVTATFLNRLYYKSISS